MGFPRNSHVKIPGQYILDAMDLLPPCGPDSVPQDLAIEVPFGGTFRVTFRPYKQVFRGCPPSWFWLAGAVESIGAG